jgi:hypothetical protein
VQDICTLVVPLLVVCLACPWNQAGDELDLARRLASPATRDEAIQTIVSSGGKQLPILLSWTTTPPQVEDLVNLHLAMVEVFERLKSKEAVPFLVQNIDPGYAPPNTWSKSTAIIIARYPAIRALLAIGPDAIPELRRAYYSTKVERTVTPDLHERIERREPDAMREELAYQSARREHIAIVFTLAMMRDERARVVLQDAAKPTSPESIFAEEGLRWLDAKRWVEDQVRGTPK